jgi:hypothetical protein
MFKRVIILVLSAMAITLLLATVAVAWTPQEIYDDFAQNGRLSRDYSDAELHAYLNDSSLAQYGDKDIKDRLDDAVMDLIERDTFPFTGFQMMIAGIVVVVLIGGGIALRLLSRPRKPTHSA